MKSPLILLLAAIFLVGLLDLDAQTITDDVEGEVTEFTQATSDPLPAPAPVPGAISENISLPGPEANVAQQNTRPDAHDPQPVNVDELIQTARENAVPLSPKQVRANKRLAKANQRAAINLAKRDAAKAAAAIPNNSVFNDSKIALYGQVGVGDQKLGGLNLILASRNYPAAGSYAYRAEVGALLRLSEQNSLDIGLRYGLMNGLETAQRLNRPSTGQITESRSTFWLAGIQAGLDHNLLNDTEWTVAIGLSGGADVGRLQLMESVQEELATEPSEPSIPAPEEVALIKYSAVNISVTPRLSIRTPEFANGWQFQARVGYQFGENTFLQGDQNTSLRDELIYNPTGITAAAGFVVPLPRLLRK